MPQFDVFQNPRAGMFPLLVDVQSELLSSLSTRVVVPMTTAKKLGRKPLSRLNPMVKLDATEYILVVQELAAIPVTALGKHVASLAAHRCDVIAALDLLITGV